MSRSNTGVPGLSYSWKRASGLSELESKISRKTGIPLTKSGRERKMGRIFAHLIGLGFTSLLVLVGYQAVTHPDITQKIFAFLSGHA